MLRHMANRYIVTLTNISFNRKYSYDLVSLDKTNPW